MMKKLLTILSLALSVSAVALAQSGEERGSFPIRGTQTREATASVAAVKQANPMVVGEIYPNPATDQASLQLNLNAPGKIVFYNLLGTPVGSQDFGKEAKVVTLDFSNFSEGVYFGIVSSGNKTVATRRISVKR